MSKRPKYAGEPTLFRVMVRPKWVLALFLSLAVAAGFAGLAQWQMGSAIKLEEPEIDSETVYPITELTQPGTPVNDQSAGRMVNTEIQLVPEDFVIVGNRVNADEVGYWLVAHGTDAQEATHLAVALGWASSQATVEAVREELQTDDELTKPHETVGRYMPSEGVELPGPDEPLTHLTTLSTGQLINLWQPWEGEAYAGFLVAQTPPQGLDAIDSVPPLPEEKINWLNLFYALEWIVFAGFAVFFWYRLTRDAWEKEHEMKELLEDSSAAPSHGK